MALVSAIALICQQVLIEKDDVTSAIRIVELFTLPKESLNPPMIGAVVDMRLFMQLRLTPNDEDKHSLHFDLVRPDGETTTSTVFEDRWIDAPKIEGVDKTITAIGQLGVVPKQFGRHEVIVKMDGHPVTTTSFMLIEAQTQSAEQPQISPA